MSMLDKPEVQLDSFVKEYANILATKNPGALLAFNVNVRVRCPSCRILVDGEDTLDMLDGTTLRCPRCQKPWVFMRK